MKINNDYVWGVLVMVLAVALGALFGALGSLALKIAGD